VPEIRRRRTTASEAALRFAMPLAAAFLAALAAHISIDIVGDFVLAHDTYDDSAHGSRWFASIALAASAFGALAVLVRSVLAETRGCRGALRCALRAAVPASAARFAVSVAAIALPLLLAMAWLDDVCAGIGVDDFADLFGGSVPLGGGITIAFAVAAAGGLHRFVAFLSRNHRSIVRAVEAFVRVARNAACAQQFAIAGARQDRPRVPAALARCSGGNRAPPRRNEQPALA
jgi:hypothetical protein